MSNAKMVAKKEAVSKVMDLHTLVMREPEKYPENTEALLGRLALGCENISSEKLGAGANWKHVMRQVMRYNDKVIEDTMLEVFKADFNGLI